MLNACTDARRENIYILLRNIASLLPKIASSASIGFHCVRWPSQNVQRSHSTWFYFNNLSICNEVVFIYFSSKVSKIRKDAKRQKSCIISCLIRKKFKIFKKRSSIHFLCRHYSWEGPPRRYWYYNIFLVSTNLASHYNEQHCQISTKSIEGSFTY